MKPQTPTEFAANQKLAAALLVIAGLLFASFALLKPKTNEDSAVATQETIVQSPKPTPSVTSSTEANDESILDDDATGTVIRVGDSEFGSMLFDGSGQAIYIWELEDSSTAECYGSCAVAWPPVLTDGAPIASAGVSTSLLGTTQRTDGTTQVTYNGHPLYYYAHEKAGEVKCHNIRTHGGLWWVLRPDGIRAA